MSIGVLTDRRFFHKGYTTWRATFAGRCYGSPKDQPAQHIASYYAYSTWLRAELREAEMKRVNNERFLELGLFNLHGLKQALRALGRAGSVSTNSLVELVSWWIISPHDFLVTHQIKADGPSSELSWCDGVNALRGGLHARVYVMAREWLRD